MTTLDLFTGTQARKRLKIGHGRWSRLAPHIPHITDPDTGQALYSEAILAAWQERIGQLAAERAA